MTFIASGVGKRPALSGQRPTVPFNLGAAIHFDPGDITRITTNGTDVESFDASISGLVVSQSTISQQPTYNTSSGFASGRNSISFDRSSSQHLFGDNDSAVLASFNGAAPWTVAMNVIYTTSGANQTAGTFTHNTSTLHNISFFLQGGNDRHAHRYRSTTGFAQSTPVDVIQFETPIWTIFDFDGVNTLTAQNLGGSRTTGVGASGPAADSVFNQLYLGGFSGLGHMGGEIGDFVAFNRKLDDTDRTALLDWLAPRL